MSKKSESGIVDLLLLLALPVAGYGFYRVFKSASKPVSTSFSYDGTIGQSTYTRN